MVLLLPISTKKERQVVFDRSEKAFFGDCHKNFTQPRSKHCENQSKVNQFLSELMTRHVSKSIVDSHLVLYFKKVSKMENTNSMDNWDEADMKKMVSDGVFYILAQQKKKPFFKRRAVLKSIGIVQKSKILKEVLWRSIIEELNEIFGYKLEESNVKKGEFYLLNSISDPQNVKLQHLKFTDEEAGILRNPLPKEIKIFILNYTFISYS